MSGFDARFFPTLSKVYDGNDTTKEELILAGREIIEFVYPYLKYRYPQLDKLKGKEGETLKPLGVIGEAVKLPTPPIEETIKEQLGIDFPEEKHIVIWVPRMRLGVATAVIFEIPTPEEEVMPEKLEIHLNSLKQHNDQPS